MKKVAFGCLKISWKMSQERIILHGEQIIRHQQQPPLSDARRCDGERFDHKCGAEVVFCLSRLLRTLPAQFLLRSSWRIPRACSGRESEIRRAKVIFSGRASRRTLPRCLTPKFLPKDEDIRVEREKKKGIKKKLPQIWRARRGNCVSFRPFRLPPSHNFGRRGCPGIGGGRRGGRRGRTSSRGRAPYQCPSIQGRLTRKVCVGKKGGGLRTVQGVK